MIQRKQTLFLLIIFLVSITLLLNNFQVSKGLMRVIGDETEKAYHYKVGFINTQIMTDEVFTIKNSLLTYVLSVVSLLSIVAVFLYTKLALQIRMAAFNFIFILLTAFNMIYTIYKLNHTDGIQIVSSDINYFSFVLVALLMVFNYFAFRGIKKDIELLASVDRLR
ncbi:MAG: DUF4293 family protein [Bacteroidota bacterium]|nr:DUF4293 family protein [Bacteroidota bacterium]